MTTRAKVGWLLFTLSGVLFFIVGLRTGDALTMAASVVWTLGCIMFLTDRPDEPQSSGQPAADDRYLPRD